MEQWMLRITAYAERLLKGLDELQWPEKVKKMQANWIGKSEGVSISFKIDKSDKSIEVFTTRPETLYGVTYMILAPEHELLESICTGERKEAVNSYIKETTKKSNIDRMVENKEKTGVFTGAYAINPINDEKIEIWTADYVLMDYASGAVMGVPAHDERDYEFAKRFELPVRKVIEDEGNDEERLINSSGFSGLSVEAGKEELINFIESKGFGRKTTNYKLRDWVFSRQRYWGEPIPIIHCEHCGEVPVREKELPVLLPEVKKYQPTGTGESPLADIKEWVNTTCPKCGSKARRETNTMPQWAGSSWYFLRYADPDNNEEFAAADNIRYWMPVDQYIGGIEHAVLHLLYARFYTMFLYDIGILDFEEPFTRLFNQGMINKNGEKMSKSVGNTVSPDGIVKKYGTDTLRIYELFIGPPELDSEWNDSGLEGVYRFMLKIWDICNKSIKANISKNYMLTSEIEKLVRAVDDKLQSFKLNTIISSFMSYANYVTKNSPKGIDKESLEKFINLLAPFAPHFAEEIWSRMGNRKSIFISGSWPEYDAALIIDNKIEVAIQINGKLKSTLSIHKGATKEQVKERIIQLKVVQKALEDKAIVKEIFIQDKIYNFVVK
jgi:leucyl-tRNA synthetase